MTVLWAHRLRLTTSTLRYSHCLGHQNHMATVGAGGPQGPEGLRQASLPPSPPGASECPPAQTGDMQQPLGASGVPLAGE